MDIISSVNSELSIIANDVRLMYHLGSLRERAFGGSFSFPVDACLRWIPLRLLERCRNPKSIFITDGSILGYSIVTSITCRLLGSGMNMMSIGSGIVGRC